MKKIINLTQHPINLSRDLLERGQRVREIPPSGTIARVAQTETEVGQWDYFPLVAGRYGETVGLPEANSDTLLIVSALVRTANPTRFDLVSPARLLRDESGRIIGCGALEVNR